MKHFTIENDNNNITVYGSAKEAEAVPDSERFSNEAGLAKLAVNWPATRLADIWNSLPGVTEVKKFKDRATAVSRIWKAIQSLGQAEPVATDEAEPETAPIADQLQQPVETVRPDTVIPEVSEPSPDIHQCSQDLREFTNIHRQEPLPASLDRDGIRSISSPEWFHCYGPNVW